VRPVGDQPAGVYWRRRILIVGLALIVLFFVLRACGGDDQAPVVSPASTPTTTATETAAATPSPTQTAVTPTTSPTPTTTSAAVAACDPASVRVTATVTDEQYPVGGPVPIRFVVRTNTTEECLRDVGAAANTVTVTSEGRRIWSSDDCTPGGEPDIRRISQTKPFAVTVTWQGDVSRPGCASPRPKAPAGTYDVQGRNGDVTGPKDSFTLG
jgi:hypothetical protein